MGVVGVDQARAMVKERMPIESDKEMQKWIKEREKLQTVHRITFTLIHELTRTGPDRVALVGCRPQPRRTSRGGMARVWDLGR